MSIYTRSGDDGSTALPGGGRTGKDALRVEAYGAADEAVAFVGLARAAADDPALSEVLAFVQHRLFGCSGALALPAGAASGSTRPPAVDAADVAALEAAIDAFEARTGPLRGFVIEGSNELAARLHAARTVVRRAERRAVALAAAEPVDAGVLAFLNRCSDLLFSAARYANAIADAREEAWDPAAPPPSV